jgi:hypothetical protein
MVNVGSWIFHYQQDVVDGALVLDTRGGGGAWPGVVGASLGRAARV